MMWDIVVVILVAVALVLGVWEKFSKKKFTIKQRIDLSAGRTICLILVVAIESFKYVLDLLLLETSVVKAIVLCVALVWLFFEVWNQTDLIRALAPKDDEWVD